MHVRNTDRLNLAHCELYYTLVQQGFTGGSTLFVEKEAQSVDQGVVLVLESKSRAQLLAPVGLQA